MYILRIERCAQYINPHSHCHESLCVSAGRDVKRKDAALRTVPGKTGAGVDRSAGTLVRSRSLGKSGHRNGFREIASWVC